MVRDQWVKERPLERGAVPHGGGGGVPGKNLSYRTFPNGAMGQGYNGCFSFSRSKVVLGRTTCTHASTSPGGGFHHGVLGTNRSEVRRGLECLGK